MNPKFPLNGRIYMLTVGRVLLTTNASQISLCPHLFRATLKVRLGSRLWLLLEWTTLTTRKRMHVSNCHKLHISGPAEPPATLTTLHSCVPIWPSILSNFAPVIHILYYWLCKVQGRCHRKSDLGLYRSRRIGSASRINPSDRIR